jgi:hypothetical protein
VSLYSRVLPQIPDYTATINFDLGDASQLDEATVRDEGLKVYIVLENDNWNEDVVSQVGQYLTCAPADKSYNCFDGMVTPSMFKWDKTYPCVVSLELTREQTRLFNINQTMIVRFNLPGNGLGFTMKNVEMNQNEKTNSFKITYVPVANGNRQFSSPVVSLNGAQFRTDISPDPATSTAAPISTSSSSSHPTTGTPSSPSTRSATARMSTSRNRSRSPSPRAAPSSPPPANTTASRSTAPSTAR